MNEKKKEEKGFFDIENVEKNPLLYIGIYGVGISSFIGAGVESMFYFNTPFGMLGFVFIVGLIALIFGGIRYFKIKRNES